MATSIIAPTSSFPSERAPYDKIQLPLVTETSWRAGAVALLAEMTSEGQQRALASWAKVGFTPPLPVPPTPVLAPAAAGLLDDFTVLDLEFQGTDLLELAAVRYQRWQPVGTLQTFVRFRGELNYHVTSLTGITRGNVWNAPEEKAVLQQFKALAGDSVLVAHNVLTADRRVLEAARTRQGATAPLLNPWLCTMALAKLRLPKDQKCGLGELCKAFGIATHGAHRALRDVEMCAALLALFHRQQPITELVTSTAKPKKVGQASLFPVAA